MIAIKSKHFEKIAFNAVVGAVVTTIGLGSLVGKILPSYTLMNEKRKRSIMLNQNELLRRIAESTAVKPAAVKKEEQRFSVEPLA